MRAVWCGWCGVDSGVWCVPVIDTCEEEGGVAGGCWVVWCRQWCVWCVDSGVPVIDILMKRKRALLVGAVWCGWCGVVSTVVCGVCQL